MKAGEIMTTRVVSVSPDASILEAVRLMLQNQISGLPVMDQAGKLVGIVTEGDLLRRAETGTQRKRGKWLEFFTASGRLADEYVHSHGRKVAEVMTLDPLTITEDTPLEEVVGLMEEKRIKRLPVTRQGSVVGIVSRANLLHALASAAREVTVGAKGDAAIREQVLAEVSKQKWVPESLINVVVRNGVVELWGTIFDERERQALRVAAENVAGVKDIKDHLVWVEPMSGMAFEAPADEAAKAKVG